MTAMSEGLLVNSKYIKMGREKGWFQSFLTLGTSCSYLPCDVTVIHLLRLCNRK